MKRVSASFFGLAIVLFLTVAAMKPVNGFSCVKAKLSLLTCLPFLTTGETSPSSVCCNAMSNVKASAPTKPELREACDCLKEAVNEVPNIDNDGVTKLPKLCNLDIGFPISKDIDCTKFSL